MKIKRLPVNEHRKDWVDFTGGLDITSPQIKIPPGYCRASMNFEENILGGYQSLTGYERYNGAASPSSAFFYFLGFSAPGTVAIGDTITGASSGATGVVIAISVTQFILTAVTGTWSAESTVSGSAVVTGPASVGSAVDSDTSNYQFLASQYYRSAISAVGTTGAPCSGPVLGVWYFKGVVYAFRNLVAGGVGMFASSSSGWQYVSLGIEVYYKLGSGAEPLIGSMITQGSNHGVLTQITIEGGTFPAGTATGRMIFASVTGAFTAAAFTAGIAATCVAQSAITLPNQNGRFEFVTDNFYGLSTSNKIYGADGVNRGFEFDGTTFVPINTGMGYTPINTSAPAGGDAPLHVVVHAGYLFYSFFGSVQFSSVGNPYNWTAISGATEIGVSDTVTGFMPQPGNETSPALAIYCRNHTYILYGSSATTWNLVSFNNAAGAIAYGTQKIVGHTYLFDDRGVTNMQTSLIYGNFVEATISQRVKTLLSQKRSLFVDSHIMRDKQQFRLFFSDGSGIYVTLGENINSFMPVQFPDIVTCSVSQEFGSGLANGGGPDVAFFGSQSGYVMQMERGTSFDGQPISAYMNLVFNNEASYRLLKRYRRLSLELIGIGYSEFFTSYDLNYASTDYGQPDVIETDISLAAFAWDSGVTWDSNITWDGAAVTNAPLAIEGDGMNIAVKLQLSSTSFPPVKFSGILIEYSPYRMQR